MPQRSKRGGLSRHRQNETWLQEQALAASRGAIVVTDPNEPDNPIVYANPAFERVTGYSIEEAVGKNCRFLQGEDRDQPALEELRAAIREGRECQAILRNYKKDGTLFWNGFSISPVHDEEGNLANFVGVLDDITERKRGEEARARLAAIIESSDDAIIGKTLDGVITSWNKGAQKIYGYSAEEVAGKPINILVPPERPDEIPKILDRIRHGEAGDHYETVRMTKDGRRLNISLTVSPIKDAMGNIVGASTVARDITERKRTEDALQESEERFRATFEQAAVGVSHVAPDGRWLRVNDKLCEIVGYGREELLGMRFRDITHPDDLDRDLEHVRRMLEGETDIYSTEKRYVRKDGSLIWVELTTSLLRDPSGEPKYFISVTEDITERKRVEKALREQTETLEKVNRIGRLLSSELDLQKLVQAVTDEATELTGARFGAFFYNVVDDRGEYYTLYTISGAPREAFSKFPMPRKTEIFGPTFEGEGVLRATDIREDPRYGNNPPYNGMPEGHLPVVSYLAVPVVSRSGETLGGLFFGHPEAGIFGEREEQIAVGLAAQAAIAIDNARLFESVRESEDRLSLAVESTELGTWDFNPLTGDLRWDDRCKAMFGLPPEAEVDYETFLEGLHPEDRQRVDRVVQRSLDPASGGGYGIEYRTVGIEDGVERWVLTRGQAYFDEGGRAVRFTGTVLDITERKRAEEALRQSELLYRTVLKQATENIFLVDAQTRRIVESNPAFRATLGYTEEELRRMTLYDIVAADRKSVDANIGRILQQKNTFVGERKYRRKDDSLVDVEVSASIILRDDRETFCVVAHDVTERKKNEEAQRFLAEASASLSSSLDYRATLSRVARLVVPYLADWCAIDILEEDGSLDRLALTHQDPDKVALARELEERYPPDPEARRGAPQVLRTGQPELVPEIPESLLDESVRDARHREILRELGFKSYVIVPLVARGRTLGAITLVSAESRRRYGPAELELAEELARRAALAVDNARLYRGRSEIARTLQGSLLPSHLPEVPGIEVGLRYLPAGEVDVGGDFYDLFDARVNGEAPPSEPSSSWGMVIGDVCGKGAEAAAMLALARHTIRAVAMREIHPSAILAALNEAMLRQRHERDDYKFCTIGYARLETGEEGAEGGARIIVSCGGHSAPVLLKSDGSIRKIRCSGRALGVFDDANLTEQEAHLAPGDALVFYTDGVTEARAPDGTFFGEERFESLLRSSVGLDASTLASHIESAVLDFQENDPRDDVAVLVLRVSD